MNARTRSRVIRRFTEAPDQPPAASFATTDRHQAAVARSLGWAQESAERGDYADALEWIQALEAIGERLPPGYHTKRQAWCSALSNNESEG